MFNAAFGKTSDASLLQNYSSLLSDAILRNRAYTAEQTAKIEADLASAVKSEFIATMSHELRTPLNTVIGFSKLLSEHSKRRLTDDEIVEYASLIFSSAGQLLAVINDILDISKIQSGKYTLDAREISVEEIVHVCATTFQKPAADAGLTFKTTIAVDLPSVRGDAIKLRQVISNLLSNAVKFTPKGGAVRIEAVRINTGGVAIFVRDTGVGMSPDDIAVALTPFGQVDGGRSRWREGTGLGLPIAKALVDLHGGTLDLRSVKDQGTEVVVILPGSKGVEQTYLHQSDTFSFKR